MTQTPLPLTPAPQTVRTSALLYLIGAVLGIIAAVVTLVTLPGVIDEARRQAEIAVQGQDTGGVDVGGFAVGFAIAVTVLSVVVAVVLAVLTILFARRMRAGRNWARIVLAVFAGLQILGVTAAFGAGALRFLVALAALILSFLPTSNAWFRQLRSASTRV